MWDRGTTMLLPLLVAIPCLLAVPWFPLDRDAIPTASPPPITISPSSMEALPGFDAPDAARRVVEETAVRLRARGLAVRATAGGGFSVAADNPGAGFAEMAAASGRPPEAPPGGAITLTVGFGSAATPWASGTETRFVGEGEGAWRLASRVQRRVVSGLYDVVGYRGYDRGAVEMPGPGPLPAAGATSPEENGMVEARLLFPTNPEERMLLEWPETLQLLSAALADAVADYLDPAFPTPPRSRQSGWRSGSPWAPVQPWTIWRAEVSPRLGLTFDGGASSAPTPAILAALREAGVKATMFMTADFVARNPELVVQMAKDGHEFGNHSAAHPDMARISDAAVVSELERLESAVVALTGKSTRPWFRPPYGSSSPHLERLAAEQGYYVVMWTADSADWRPEMPASMIQERLLRYGGPGAILIQHLGSPQSAQLLPDTLRIMKERGVAFGTLSDLVGTP